MSRWLGLGFIAIAILAGRRRRGADSVGEHAADDVDGLGRVITSEANGYSEAERLAIAWTVRNRARKRGVSIAQLVCWPSCGPQGKDRPFSSARAANETNRALARRVLAAPQSEDPTRGATAFFEPQVQDKLVAEGRPGYRFTSEQVRAKWQREGQQHRATVGKFEFWV
jgi:spore germination cell wall hydrolase CwlJ-like protein